MANIVHQNEGKYGLLKEFPISIKFSKYSLYSAPIALYSLVLVLLI